MSAKLARFATFPIVSRVILSGIVRPIRSGGHDPRGR